MCISSRVPKRCRWILTCLVCPTLSTYVGVQSCIEIMMWWPANSKHDAVRSPPPQNLTQWSTPITRLASDLIWVHQKYHCTVQYISSFQDDGIFLGSNNLQLQDVIKEIQDLGLNIKDQGHHADVIGVNIKELKDGPF